MHVFKHPKYYEEMRQRAKKFQKEEKLKPQASSSKQQASSKVGSKASSLKQQATSVKRQAVRDD